MLFSDGSMIHRLLVVWMDDETESQLSPALQTLRLALPDTAIALLTYRQSSEVTPLLPWVNEVLTYTINWQEVATAKALIELLRDRSFDAAIICTSATHSPFPLAYLCYLAGIPIRISQSSEFGGSVLSDCIKPALDRTSADRHLYLLNETTTHFNLAHPR